VKFKNFPLLLFLITLSLINPAQAVTKAIKVMPVTPTLITKLSGSAGDQISAMATTATEIALIGTLESTTATDLITSPALGGSDGFISSITPAGAHLWDLRLGGAGDEIATAIVRDKVGSFWIAGSATKPVIPVATSPIDTQSVNIDGIVVDPISTPTNSLTQLTVWKVSLTGALQSTYSIDAGGLVAPDSITFDGTNFTITGALEEQRFSTKISQSGEFSKLVKISSKAPISPSIQTFKAGTGSVKSFISKGAIAGIPSWKPKSSIPVLIEYNKLKAITRASYFQGKVIAVTWQSGVGPIVITERSDGYGISILGLTK